MTIRVWGLRYLGGLGDLVSKVISALIKAIRLVCTVALFIRCYVP